MTSFSIPALPSELHWKNSPVTWAVGGADGLHIEAGPTTDWFIDPQGTLLKDDAPVALFEPPTGDFTLQARVTVDFAAAFDRARNSGLPSIVELQVSPQALSTKLTL